MNVNHAPTISVKHEIISKAMRKSQPAIIHEMGKAFNVKIGIEHSDANGNLKQKITPEFKSYVSNFGYILDYAFSGSKLVDNKSNIKDTSGANPAAAIFKMEVDEAALVSPNPTEYGIWVGDTSDLSGLGLPLGDSNTALNYSDHDLRRMFQAEGYVTGFPDSKLNYGATVLSFLDSSTFRIKRTFTNGQPATDLKLDEIGIIGKSGSDFLLLARDGFGSVITMAPTDVVNVYYDITVADSNGFVENFLGLLSSKMAGGVPIQTLKDVESNNSAFDFSADQLSSSIGDAVLGDDTYGILIGGEVDGTLPFPITLSKNNYKRSRPIYEASMAHKETVILAVEESTTQNKTIVSYRRDFENVGIQSVNVNEVGVFMKEAATTNKYYMLGYSKVEGEAVDYVTVAPGEIFRITYSLSFPLGTIALS